jgi:hypothetical protein
LKDKENVFKKNMYYEKEIENLKKYIEKMQRDKIQSDF